MRKKDLWKRTFGGSFGRRPRWRIHLMRFVTCNRPKQLFYDTGTNKKTHVIKMYEAQSTESNSDSRAQSILRDSF
jgi:hypothetical protein